MHFSRIAASVALVGSAMAYYEQTSYYTTVEDYETKVYTSVSTCAGSEPKPTYPAEPEAEYPSSSAPAPYYPSTTVAPYPTTSAYPYPDVTYTSYDVITVTSCADYVPSCPAKVYTSTAYSTCKGGEPTPVPTHPIVYEPPTYEPPSNYSSPPTYEEPEYEAPSDYPPSYATETSTVSAPCPTLTPSYTKPAVPHYSKPVYEHPSKPVDYPVPTKSYYPSPPVYTKPAGNETYPVPPPSYTGSASSNSVSFGVAAIAAVVGLFIAA